ncbi:Uncharacterised protein [uncultured archaeon]|nr:Uncharacterised protein [uncultured archaeon]
MQSNSYIFSHANFMEQCNQIGVVNLNYVAAITEDYASQQPGQPQGIFPQKKSVLDAAIFRSGLDSFYCSNIQPVNSGRISDFAKLNDLSDSRMVSRVFPIAVEDNKVVKPMHLVIIAWR